MFNYITHQWFHYFYSRLGRRLNGIESQGEAVLIWSSSLKTDAPIRARTWCAMKKNGTTNEVFNYENENGRTTGLCVRAIKLQ